MRNLLRVIFILIIAFNSLSVQAQSVKDDTKYVRENVNAINKEIYLYKKVTKSIDDESAEGGELTRYLKAGQIKKLTVIYYGETGKTTEDYYFIQNKLLFYYRNETHYKAPISVNPKPTIATADEMRCYFKNGLIFKSIDSQEKAMQGDQLKKFGDDLHKKAGRLKSK